MTQKITPKAKPRSKKERLWTAVGMLSVLVVLNICFAFV